MKTIEVKRQLLEEALDQLKGAQQDSYVLSTQNVIDELEAVLRQPDVIKSVCRCKEGKQGRTVDENFHQICDVCGGL